MSKYLVKKEATVYEVNPPTKEGVEVNMNNIRKHTFKVGEIVDSEMRSRDGGYSYSRTPTVIVDGIEYGTLFINRWAEPIEPENMPIYKTKAEIEQMIKEKMTGVTTKTKIVTGIAILLGTVAFIVVADFIMTKISNKK